MKKIISSLALTLAFTFCASGCSFKDIYNKFSAVSITSVEKTGSDGLVDTYTIYYSDGSTSSFQITNGANGENGKDGKDGVNGTDGKDGENGKDGANGTNGTNGADGEDGKDITARELYEMYVAEYGEISYEEFLSQYLSVSEEHYTAINELLQTTARVHCEFTETQTTGEEKTVGSAGAAVIYKMDGEYTYLLTNYHVIYNEEAVGSKTSERIHCYLYGSESYPTKEQDSAGNEYYDYGDYGIECSYIGGAASYDLALIKAKTADITAVNPNAKEIVFADDYFVGQTAITVGNPNNDGLSVTQGIVSVDNEYISLSVDGTARSYRSIRIDTALYKGNSGGGLFNTDGQLIGISNAGRLTDQNINYAIPLQIVKGVAENLLYYHKDGDMDTNGVYKPTVGIEIYGQNAKYTYNATLGYGKISEEIVLNSVTESGIADGLGLQAGDIITGVRIDGTVYAPNRCFEIGDLLLRVKQGARLSFIYLRESESLETESYTLTAEDISRVE